jgi:hypothetical protein
VFYLKKMIAAFKSLKLMFKMVKGRVVAEERVAYVRTVHE